MLAQLSNTRCSFTESLFLQGGAGKSVYFMYTIIVVFLLMHKKGSTENEEF